MFKVPTKTLLQETCYHLCTIESLDQESKIYISIQDVLEKSIWNSKTLKEYLKRKKVSIVFTSEINSWDYLYLRKDVLKAISDMSNDKEDYLKK